MAHHQYVINVNVNASLLDAQPPWRPCHLVMWSPPTRCTIVDPPIVQATFRFHRARGSGPLARPAAALTRIVIAFATLACLREQRASLAAHHSSPNCCHPGSTTPLPAKPDVHTASTLTQPLSTFFIVVNRKRSNGKSTVAAFDPQTTQHASTGQPFNAVSYGSTSSPSPSAASTSS